MSFQSDYEDMLESDQDGQGHWVLIRHFDRTQKSEYFNEVTQEAVGGPAWEFTDNITRSIKEATFDSSRPSSTTGLQIQPNIGVEMIAFRYFLKASVTIEIDDQIFDLEHTGTTPPPSGADYTKGGDGAEILGKYIVREVLDFRADGGRIQYKVAIAARSFAT